MADLHLMRVFLSLLAVISLLLAALWLLRRLPGARNLYGQIGPSSGKRWGGKPQARRLTLLHTLALGSPRTHLALVRVDREELLLAVTAGQIALLHTLPRKEMLAASAPQTAAAVCAPPADSSDPASTCPPGRFASLLAHLRKGNNGNGNDNASVAAAPIV